MARIKIAYIGGGSTRAPGTVASLIEQGDNFKGSEIVLIDLNEDHLLLVKKLAEKIAMSKGVEITFSATTHRRCGLTDADAVLTSFRPGGFEARFFDESIPLKHGVIGQETQGPGGFFMALRSIHVMKEIIADIEAVCPKARLFNYTNPVNIVAEAVCRYSSIPTVSLCEGSFLFPREVALAAGLNPTQLDTTMIGLNHGCWSVRHLHDGEDFIAKVERAYHEKKNDPELNIRHRRLLELTTTVRAIPAQYFLYYYYRDEILTDLKAKPTTRAQDIMAATSKYWNHYREQAEAIAPKLDPDLSRGGLNELEIAIDVMDAIFNDRKEVWPVNVPNNGAIADFSSDLVVEVPGLVDRHGIKPLTCGSIPKQVAGLTQMLAEYQSLTATAAWEGTRREAIQALTSNPLVLSLSKAEAIYDEMARAHRQLLPERLLA